MGRLGLILACLALPGLLTYCGKSSDSAQPSEGSQASLMVDGDHVMAAQSAADSTDTAGSATAGAPASSSSDRAATWRAEILSSLRRPPLPTGGGIDPKDFASDANHMFGPNNVFSLKGDVNARIGGCATGSMWSVKVDDSEAVFSGQVDIDPNSCHGGRKFSGTCNITAILDPTGPGDEFDVTENIKGTLSGGDIVAIGSRQAGNPTYTITSSGSPSSGSVTMSVSIDEQRTRTGKSPFEHMVYTDPNSPVIIINSYDSTGTKVVKREATGTIHVHQDMAKFLATHTLKALTHDLTGTCACPTSGEVTQTIVKDGEQAALTRVYTFTGCGTAKVETSGSIDGNVAKGEATVTLDSCQ